MCQFLSSRTVALEILDRVDAGELLHLVFADEMNHSSLPPRDRHLCQELSFGVTRMRLRYDAFIEQLAKSASPGGSLRNIIRLGLHQLFSMRLPDHAAINETVELARSAGLSSKTGFINALLRTAQRLGEEQLLSAALEGLSPMESLGVEYSHPTWVVSEYFEQLERCGLSSDLVVALAYNNSLPKVQLAFASNGALAALKERVALKETALPLCQSLEGSLDPGILTPEVWVQDLASQAVTRAFHSAIPDDATVVVDACAAPGGKSRLLRNLLPEKTHLLSIDKSESRLESLRQSARGENWKVSTADFTAVEGGGFDAVLIDAPCSSLGSVRRKPDTKYRSKRVDLANYFDQQTALLEATWRNLRPGGIVGYATCTPTVNETDRVIRKTLDLGWQTLDTERFLGEPASDLIVSHRPNGAAMLWGYKNASDTMFLALLRKPETR
jgi:16S rRNA (cytosine967-C5)-methyltransferase